MDGIEFPCPYCGSPNAAIPDPGEGLQQWTLDCETCCRPVSVRLRVEGGEVADLEAEREQD